MMHRNLNSSVQDANKEVWIKGLGFKDRPTIKDICISKM